MVAIRSSGTEPRVLEAGNLPAASRGGWAVRLATPARRHRRKSLGPAPHGGELLLALGGALATRADPASVGVPQPGPKRLPPWPPDPGIARPLHVGNQCAAARRDGSDWSVSSGNAPARPAIRGELGQAPALQATAQLGPARRVGLDGEARACRRRALGLRAGGELPGPPAPRSRILQRGRPAWPAPCSAQRMAASG